KRRERVGSRLTEFYEPRNIYNKRSEGKIEFDLHGKSDSDPYQTDAEQPGGGNLIWWTNFHRQRSKGKIEFTFDRLFNRTTKRSCHLYDKRLRPWCRHEPIRRKRDGGRRKNA